MTTDIERALSALESRNPYERITAIEMLAKFQYADGVQRIIAASYDPQRRVSEAAIWALGDIGSSIALERLSSLVKHAHHSHGLRWAAIHSLGMIGDVSTIPLLLRTYADFDNGELCEVAARSIVRFGEQATLPLIQILNNRQHETDLIRQGAACLLGLLQDERAISDLVNAILEDDAAISWQAIHALGQIGEPATVPFLISLLETQPEHYTPIILWSLCTIGTAQALNTVQQWQQNNPGDGSPFPIDNDEPFLPPSYPTHFD